MATYVALLRGINLGSANRIAMPVYGPVDRCRDLADRWLPRNTGR